MRRRELILLVMAAVGGGAPLARADVVLPSPRAPTLWLADVTMIRGDAPSADRAAVETAVRRQLVQQDGRLRACLADVDLREDAVRRRARRVTGHMRFDRSGRPRVRLGRSRGVPEAARRCVMEAARSVSAPAPRGTVEIRFVYAVR